MHRMPEIMCILAETRPQIGKFGAKFWLQETQPEFVPGSFFLKAA